MSYSKKDDDNYLVPFVLLVLMFAIPMAFSQQDDDSNKIVIEQFELPNTEGRVKTQYDINGRPINQSEEAKGLHYITGSVTLSGGRATINFNTSTADGKQDVSFIGVGTYRGIVWSTDTSNINVYKIVPLSGIQCLIMSDSISDVSTVNYRLVGE